MEPDFDALITEAHLERDACMRALFTGMGQAMRRAIHETTHVAGGGRNNKVSKKINSALWWRQAAR